MYARLDFILRGLGLKDLLPLFEKEGVDDSLLEGMSEDELRSIGVEKLGDRKRLLKEFGKLGPSGFAAKPMARQAAPGASAVGAAPSAAVGRYSDQCLGATLARPFLNSLRVPMVPIPRGKTLFSVWPVRVRDYAEYCGAAGIVPPTADFVQGADHPVVNVQWHDARRFCEWLTKREVWLGLIPDLVGYRLPTDEEWSTAVGMSYESGHSPRARSGVVEGFPWNGGFPPPATAGNYHARFGCGFAETSPVGSFPANKFGIFDLGGNVWEWCMEEFEPGNPRRVMRGASCFNDDPLYLMSSFRDHFSPDSFRNNLGFRVVLAAAVAGDPWGKA